jgi:hypothetical protein
MKRQVYTELNGFRANKNPVQQFVDQWMCNAYWKWWMTVWTLSVPPHFHFLFLVLFKQSNVYLDCDYNVFKATYSTVFICNVMKFNDALCDVLVDDSSVFITFVCSYRRQFLEMCVLKIRACMPACVLLCSSTYFVVIYNLLIWLYMTSHMVILPCVCL